MRDEGQVLFSSLPHVLRSLLCKCLDREADCAIENAIQDMEGSALEGQPVRLGEVVDTAAQDVVLGHHLGDVVTVLDALQPVGGRARRAQRLGNRFVRSGAQCGDELIDELGEMVIQCRRVQVAGRRQLTYLPAPLGEQLVSFQGQERRQLVEIGNVASPGVSLT